MGVFITSELEKADSGRKKVKGQAQAEAARKRVLNKYLDGTAQVKAYADPAAYSERMM